MKKNKNRIMESYRRLWNIVEDLKNTKCISFTSNSYIEGKTIIAKNMAITLAKNGKKTLFIDCNMPSNSNIKRFNHVKVKGLIEILKDINSAYISDAELKNYINDTQRENLSILALGDYNLDNSMSVFKTENLKLALERLKISFDYIIIDAPSFENLSYTQIVTRAADGCLFVLKEGIYEVGQGPFIKERIDTMGCKVLGCILDKEKKSTKIFDDEYSGLFNLEYRTRKNKMKKNIGAETV